MKRLLTLFLFFLFSLSFTFARIDYREVVEERTDGQTQAQYQDMIRQEYLDEGSFTLQRLLGDVATRIDNALEDKKLPLEYVGESNKLIERG